MNVYITAHIGRLLLTVCDHDCLDLLASFLRVSSMVRSNIPRARVNVRSSKSCLWRQRFRWIDHWLFRRSAKPNVILAKIRKELRVGSFLRHVEGES